MTAGAVAKSEVGCKTGHRLQNRADFPSPRFAPGELEALARRVYELHRERDLARGRNRARIPTWPELDEPTRSQLIATYWRARASYEVGRREPREVRIG